MHQSNVKLNLETIFHTTPKNGQYTQKQVLRKGSLANPLSYLEAFISKGIDHVCWKVLSAHLTALQHRKHQYITPIKHHEHLKSTQHLDIRKTYYK